MSNIAVVGSGYVGLTTGACMSHLGHDVVCMDVDAEKIAMLCDGKVPIREEGLERLVVEGIHTGKLHFTTDHEKAVGDAEFVFLCLPTPQSADGSADLSYVHDACRQISAFLLPGAIVINKSTVPVGTSRLVSEALALEDVHVVSNPEFLRQGTAVQDFLSPDRIVIGALEQETALRVASLYLDLAAPWVVTDPASAELIKYVANSFLATKLSFVNAIAAISEEVGADVEDVIDGVGHDRRIGHDFMRPGPGWGGSCLPKDTSALDRIASDAGYDFGLLRAAMEVNTQQFERIVDKVASLLDGRLDGRRIAAWGLTFKADTDDLRSSPSLEVLRRLVARGAVVTAYDPGARVDALPRGTQLAPSAIGAAMDADALVVLTEWPEFRMADLDCLFRSMARPNVVDSRNMFDLDALTRRGFRVRAVGRGGTDSTGTPHDRSRDGERNQVLRAAPTRQTGEPSVTLTTTPGPSEVERSTDPYRDLAAMRDQGPVAISHDGFAIVTGYEAARDALRHPACLSGPIAAHYVNSLPPGAARDEMGHRINFLDPPEHSRVRGLISRSFTPRRVRELYPWIQRTSVEQLGELRSSAQPFDLISQFAHVVPSLVISELLGVPTADRDKLTMLSDATAPLLGVNATNEEKIAAIEAAEAMHGYLENLLAERSENPSDDLLSDLLEAEDDGQRLNHKELLSLAATLYSAGHRTTRDLFCNGMSALLRNPERYRSVVRGTWAIPDVVREFLRYEPPTMYVARVPVESVTLAGTEIAAETPILVYLGAANRDPSVFEAPDEFRPRPEEQAPLSFAFGAHHCLGAALATLETEVMLDSIRSMAPFLELLDTNLVWQQRGPFRGLEQLLVRF